MQPWNAVRCAEETPPGQGHVESYFLKLNDREGRRALWVKATILVRQGGTPRVAEAWAVGFDRQGGHVAVKETTPLASARFGRGDLDVEVKGLRLREGRIDGEVGTSEHRIAIDLAFTTDDTPLVPYPPRLYEGPLPSQKLVSPHPDVRFSGTYEVDGETIVVDGWRGMQGHNWGRRHTELYAWGHVNEWDGGEDLVFEGATGRVKVGPALAPPLSVLCVRHRGVRYDFNSPRAILTARGTIDPRRWSFAARTSHATLTGEMWADTRDFVGLAYENPDGAVTHCLNSKIARAHLRLSVRGRPDVEVMTRAAALEIGTKARDHGIAILA